jgi:predicted MFS family arabinose efflux permease
MPFLMILSLIGLFFGAAYFNSQFHGVAGSVNRSARAGTHEVLLSLGIAIGSIGGGLIYQKFSMAAVYYICIGVLLAGLLTQNILCGRFKKAGGAS